MKEIYTKLALYSDLCQLLPFLWSCLLEFVHCTFNFCTSSFLFGNLQQIVKFWSTFGKKDIIWHWDWVLITDPNSLEKTPLPVLHALHVGTLCGYLCEYGRTTVYANYIGPSVMTDANSEGFPICNERITENDRCVIKIIGIHWNNARSYIFIWRYTEWQRHSMEGHSSHLQRTRDQ